MDKRGAIPTPHKIVVLAIIIIVVGAVLWLYFSSKDSCYSTCKTDKACCEKYPTCKFIDNKCAGWSIPESKGWVFETYDLAKAKALDPSFEFLFGKNFESSINVLIGKKDGWTAFGWFIWYMIKGALTVIFIIFISLIFGILLSLFEWKNYWLNVALETKKRSIKYVGIIIIYPTLMSIPVVNQLIKLVTLSFLTPWWLDIMIISIIVVYGPNMIMGIIQKKAEFKAQRAVLETAVGAKAFRNTGKELLRQK